MNLQTEIVDWLHGRPDWIQDAATRILKNGTLSSADYSELVSLCKTDEGQKKTKTRIFPGLAGNSADIDNLRFVSIGNINGIENMAPRESLLFGDSNLTVVYGSNGSGKSGYTRILKKACGKSHAVELRSNVFGPIPSKQSCTITYKLGEVPCPTEWQTKEDPISALSAVDIFDTDCGRLYLDEEKQASYVPAEVLLLDLLVKACEHIKERLNTELDGLPSKLPAFPSNLLDTETFRTYSNLKATYTEKELEAILLWAQADETALKNYEERLKSDDPAKLASQKLAKKAQLDRIIDDLTVAVGKLSPGACKNICDVKSDAVRKRASAVESADILSSSVSLKGVGSSTWRALWEAARLYSTSEAYPIRDYPVVDSESKCVLCQQSLAPDAQQSDLPPVIQTS